jgi:hypothetical protein
MPLLSIEGVKGILYVLANSFPASFAGEDDLLSQFAIESIGKRLEVHAIRLVVGQQ